MLGNLMIEILQASGETLYMLIISGLLTTLLGIPLGVLLFSLQKPELLGNKRGHFILEAIVNALRSLPFVILMIALIPVTRFLIGTAIGTTAAIVPLTIGAIPFFARIVENALAEVHPGLIETGLAMGASPLQIMSKILLPEAFVSILRGTTVTLIALLGYSAMAGAIGGGGLGDLAIRYGYQRFDVKVMVITVLVLIVLVQIIQNLGNRWVNQNEK